HDTKTGDTLYGSQALMAWRRDGLQLSDDGKLKYQGNNAGSLTLGQMRLEFDDATGRLTTATCASVASAETKVAQALSETPAGVEAIARAARVSVSSAAHALPKLVKSRIAEPVVVGSGPSGGR